MSEASSDKTASPLINNLIQYYVGLYFVKNRKFLPLICFSNVLLL